MAPCIGDTLAQSSVDSACVGWGGTDGHLRTQNVTVYLVDLLSRLRSWAN